MPRTKEEEKRTRIIKIMQVMESWNEEHGFETSAAMDYEIANVIYLEAFVPEVKDIKIEDEK